jgi:hypothetical protein
LGDLDDHKIPHINEEYDIRMSSKNYEAKFGFADHLVSYLARSGCREKNPQITQVCLMFQLLFAPRSEKERKKERASISL